MFLTSIISPTHHVGSSSLGESRNFEQSTENSGMLTCTYGAITYQTGMVPQREVEHVTGCVTESLTRQGSNHIIVLGRYGIILTGSSASVYICM